MDQGNQWLKDTADGMREAIANGAAPTPERLTVRQLIGQFGYTKRMDSAISKIRNGLERNNLITDPDFAVGWIGSAITIRLDSESSDSQQPHLAADPTHRISSLEAANSEPIKVHPDSELKAATTIMQLHDFSQLPVMTSERDLSGTISWTSIGSRLALGRECKYVRECMDPAQEVQATTPLFEAIATITEHGYVLVRGTDRRITGIVTATDLSLQFMQLAGPFLFVGEIEGHLRHMIHGKFTLEQLRAASTPEEASNIEGSGDLDLGRILPVAREQRQLGIARVEYRPRRVRQAP